MKLTTLVAFALMIPALSFAAKTAPAKKTEAKPMAAAVVPTISLDTKTSVVRWIGSKVAGKHHGTMKLKGGDVAFVNDKPVGGSFKLDLASINDEDLTDPEYKNKLETHLKSPDFFDVGKHEHEGEFVITNITPKSGNDYQVTGKLSLKGIDKEVSFPATVAKEGKIYSAKGNFKINRTDWGLKYNSGKFFDPKKLGDKLISDDMEVEIDLKTVGA
jgi:polyisoprenoid-binding protein YceI